MASLLQNAATTGFFIGHSCKDGLGAKGKNIF
jgi:hypothetical protein